jgi:hypothetical protein
VAAAPAQTASTQTKPERSAAAAYPIDVKFTGRQVVDRGGDGDAACERLALRHTGAPGQTLNTSLARLA